MYKDFIGWSLENVGKGTVETKYTVEYINDKKTWDEMNYMSEHYGEFDPELRQEPWDFYDKREYDDISEALTFYLTWYVNENCFFIQLWEKVYVNGELVLEQLIEPKGSMNYYLRTSINREMDNRIRRAEIKADELEKGNELYKGFIKAMGHRFEDMFDEYIKQEANKNEQ